MNPKSLQDKVALVTGASRGLGKAMALALATAGARLALVGRDADALETTAAAVRSEGAEAASFIADVTDESRVVELSAEVRERFGPVQILINNAGVNVRKPVTEFTLAEWRYVLDTNLTAAFLMCRSFVPHMQGTGYGRVINMTSIMSHISLPGRAAYSASKAGLLGLTRALALEIATDNITVVAISPGPFATEMNTALMQNPEVNQQFLASIPVGRWGRIEDIGKLALFLCSDDASSSQERIFSSMAVGVRDRRAFLSTSSTAAGALLLGGCNRGRKKRIAVIPKAVSHIFWVEVQKGAYAAGKEFDVEILWNGAPAETDFSRQMQIVDSMVAQRVDGIAVAPTERKALVTPVERAVQAGIPVTVFDSALDSNVHISYVATDNVEAGRMAARRLGELIGGKGSIGIVMHAPGSASTMDREKGFSEVVGREFPGVKIVGQQYGMSNAARSRAAAENILTANPSLAGLFASAEPGSIGAALALKAREMTDKVSLVAFDSSETMVEDLKTGAIDAMVVQDPQRMGYEAVKTLVQKLSGQSPPKRLDLNAVVVAKKDLDQQQVRRLLNLK